MEYGHYFCSQHGIYNYGILAKVQFAWIFSNMVLFERPNIEECYSVKKNCGTNISVDVWFFPGVALYVLIEGMYRVIINLLTYL